MPAHIQCVCFDPALPDQYHDMSFVQKWCACKDVLVVCVWKHQECIPETHITQCKCRPTGIYTPEVFLVDLRLCVDFIPSSRDTEQTVTLTSPCIAEADTEDVFRTHHSFRRQFNRNLKRAGLSACRFSLIHPLIETSLCSDDLVSDELCKYQFTLPHDIAMVCCHTTMCVLNIKVEWSYVLLKIRL